MRDAVRIWTGIILLLGGIGIIWIPFFGWIYGILGIVLGIVILLNKKENSIEERKDKMKGGSK